MTTLRQRAEQYLAMRRGLGYQLTDTEHLLMQFIDHLEGMGVSMVTTQAALDWARQPIDASPDWWRRRLSVVRLFARHLQTLEPATQVPPARLLHRFARRRPPHLYSQPDVQALIRAAADRLRHPLRVATYQSLIGLLTVTGIRIGEAIRLDRDDIDLDSGVLTIVNSKFGKSRQVLLHPSTIAALRRYAELRERSMGDHGAPAFFVSTRGRLLINTVDYVFANLVRSAGITPTPGVRQPRWSDFRHTFAVSTLLHWYRTGVDVQSRLPVLSTWLGHVDPSSTYWYLQASPELLAAAASRLELQGGDR